MKSKNKDMAENGDGFSVTYIFYYYLRRRLASREGIVTLGVCVCVGVCLCVRRAATVALYGALVSAAKVMRCTQCALVVTCTCQCGEILFCYEVQAVFFLFKLCYMVLPIGLSLTWKIFEWPYFCNGSYDSLCVWFCGRVFGSADRMSLLPVGPNPRSRP